MSVKSRYDFDELRGRVSAREVAERELGVRITGNRCAAAWRGGKNLNVEFFPDGCFRDYKTDEHGGPMALLAIARGISLPEAANYLGDKYCPELARDAKPKARARRAKPPAKTAAKASAKALAKAQPSAAEMLGSLRVTKAAPRTKYDELIAEGYSVVANYDYLDAQGQLAYTVVRLEKQEENERKKTFLQRRADRWGLGDAKPILYRLPQVINADKVYIVEGEKDADYMAQRGFVATTCLGGAKKWHDDLSSPLKGKAVVIITDNDPKGRQHVEIIARSLEGLARSIKIMTPSDTPKGDVTDYFLAGATNSDFLELEERTPEYRRPRAGVISPEAIAIAKELNQKPFENFKMVDGGDGKMVAMPKSTNELLQELKLRLLGYPYKLGALTLFDHDKDTRKIYEIDSVDKLFEWISRKTKHNYNWKYGTNFVPKREFYASVFACAPRFESISDMPDYPENDLVYYTYESIPPPSPDHRVFNEFLDFFCPAAPWHGIMLKTLIAAPLWYRHGCSRPSWMINSVDGTKTGKTTLVERLADLYLHAPIQIAKREINIRPEEIIKRLVSATGRKAKIVLIDNIVGDFRSETLAGWITSRVISGRAPYSAGEEARPNNLTWVMTSNGARLDTDLTCRSYFVSLARPKKNIGTWNEMINEFIEKNRMQIFADIIDILQKHTPFADVPVATRYAEFEREVLQAMCGDVQTYRYVAQKLQETHEGTNLDVDDCYQLIDCLRANLADVQGINPSEHCVWINADLLKYWTRDLDKKQNSAQCRNYAVEQLTRHFDPKLERFPKSSNLRRSGVMWIGENADRRKAHVVALIKSTPTLRGEYNYESDPTPGPGQ